MLMLAWMNVATTWGPQRCFSAVSVLSVLVFFLIAVSWAQVICMICKLQPEGVEVHIRGKSRVHVIQQICTIQAKSLCSYAGANSLLRLALKPIKGNQLDLLYGSLVKLNCGKQRCNMFVHKWTDTVNVMETLKLIILQGF